MTLADRLFSSSRSVDLAEIELINAIEKIAGGGEWWEDLTWDDYDRSFELTAVKVGKDFTDEQLAAFADLGFLRCWLNYSDDTERGYRCSPPSRGQIRQGCRLEGRLSVRQNRYALIGIRLMMEGFIRNRNFLGLQLSHAYRAVEDEVLNEESNRYFASAPNLTTEEIERIIPAILNLGVAIDSETFSEMLGCSQSAAAEAIHRFIETVKKENE